MRILLVEDDAIMCRSLEFMLNSEGYSCDTAALGEDGIAVGKLDAHDIVLLDLMLPGMGGLQVLEQLRGADIRTPILILSGMDAPDSRIEGFCLGADDVLSKPFDKRELVARIGVIVRRANGAGSSRLITGKGHPTELSEPAARRI